MASTTIAPALSLPIINGLEHGLDELKTVIYDPVRSLAYAGCMSHDLDRRSLCVFPIERAGLEAGTPRRFPDHPEPLIAHPPNQWSKINCLLLDPRFPNKLYMGLEVSQDQSWFHTSLAVYDLDHDGWPIGRPRAFDLNPSGTRELIGICWGLSMHPRLNQLYAVGYGLAGFSTFRLNPTDGEPIGPPSVYDFGAGSKYSLGFRSDGNKLYVGRHGWVLEVISLGADGAPAVSPHRVTSYSIAHPGVVDRYLAIVVKDDAVFYKGPDEMLSYFTLDPDGEPSAEPRSSGMKIHSVSTAREPGRILVAMNTGFKDAITGATQVDGTIVQEIGFDRDRGISVLSQSDVLAREIQWEPDSTALAGMPSLLSGVPAPAIAIQTKRGFVGNRIAGLKVRASLRSITASAPLKLVSNSVSMGKKVGYLGFAYSSARNMVYAAGNDRTGNKGIYVYAVGGDAAGVVSVACPMAEGPVALDDARNILYIARSDGTLAVRTLDSAGLPAADGEELPTGLSQIKCLCIHPDTGQVYVFGTAGGGAPPAGSPIVSIPVEWIYEAVVVREFNKLYACSTFFRHENVCVWTLESDGRPREAMPVRYHDGLPTTDHPRGLLFTIRVDPTRRKLCVGGNSAEPPVPGAGYIVVYDLDDAGNPSGDPRTYPVDGSLYDVRGIELSPNGSWLYAAGFGEPQIFTWKLDSAGEPEGRPKPGPAVGIGKYQLQTTADGSRLLAGSYPSILETFDLAPDGQPARGADASFVISRPFVHEIPRTIDLGLLIPGGPPSLWVDMDVSLRDGVGIALGRLKFAEGLGVTQATVEFEVVQSVDAELKPLRSFAVDIHGPDAAIVLPRYGIDDPSNLSALIQSSAERYGQHLERAKSVALAPHERPAKFVVATGLCGIDSNLEAMRNGVAAVGILGHNTIEVWNFRGVPPTEIRAAAHDTGIARFRWAMSTFKEPPFFDFDSERMSTESVAAWVDEARNKIAETGAAANELALVYLFDEPAWYFPSRTQDVLARPDSIAAFREYLRSKGLTPELLGHATWDTVSPIGLGAATGPGASVDAKRLALWTVRFFSESLSKAFAIATSTLRREFNPHLLVTTNLNNWPSRFFLPSPGKKIGNNDNVGPDAAMGMPDWFDLVRKRAVSCLWTEDWFGNWDAQLWSLYGDLLRCAAREGDLPYGGYLVGQSMSAFNVPDGASYKIMALAAHGAKVFEIYLFGEILALGDSWSELYHIYRPLTDALRLLAQGEQLLYPGRPRTGTIAILLPQASQVWDPDADERYYLREINGLHAALIHAQYPVDFVDDFAIEADALKKYGYQVLYVTAPNLSVRAQEKILSWVGDGGTLVLLPGACAADEYDQPAEIFSPVIGVTRQPLAREPVPAALLVGRLPAQDISRLSDRLPASGISTAFQISHLTPVAGVGQALANFSDGSAAIVDSRVMRGRIVTFGYWPGTTYWYSPDRSNRSRLPTGWSAAARAIVLIPVEDAGAQQHVSVSAPGVEAALLESDEGIAVTLLNWFATPLHDLSVTINLGRRMEMSEIRSLKAGTLRYENAGNELRVTLPRLETVDVVMVSYGRTTPEKKGCWSALASFLRSLIKRGLSGRFANDNPKI